MENLREKEKGKETRVGLPHLRNVRSVARTTIVPRTASSATRGQFSKQAMLLRELDLDPQVVRLLNPLHVPNLQQIHQIRLQQLRNVKGLHQVRLRWQEAQWESLEPTSMVKRCLLDTGADEHICPASFAEWIKPVAHSSQHGNKYHTVTLCVKTTEGNELGIPVTFLIGANLEHGTFGGWHESQPGHQESSLRMWAT